jgi:cytochrome c-type biogenesis protein
MSSELLLATFTAFWLGILTSISPCPLATNIAAISYVGKKVTHPGYVFITGMLYTLGRAVAYVIIGVLLVSAILSAPDISMFLQKYMSKALGPILIIAGMMLVELIRFGSKGRGISDGLQARVDKMGMWGAFLLGILFALSFCPVSAALFFGSLLPLAIQHESSILLPSSYGLATGLPVLLFAILIATGAKWLGALYNKIAAFEYWARRGTGVVFILAGIYLSLRFIFLIDL